MWLRSRSRKYDTQNTTFFVLVSSVDNGHLILQLLKIAVSKIPFCRITEMKLECTSACASHDFLKHILKFELGECNLYMTLISTNIRRDACSKDFTVVSAIIFMNVIDMI